MAVYMTRFVSTFGEFPLSNKAFIRHIFVLE